MRRIWGCMAIFSGVFTIWLSRRLPQARTDWSPRRRRFSQFGSLLRGSAFIMHGISRGLLPNPDGRTAREMEHAATRINGWLGIFGGCAALWTAMRPPQHWPSEGQPARRRLQFVGVLSGAGAIMRGIATGVMIYPPRWNGRLLRRVGSALVMASTVLLSAPIAIGIVRDNRHHGREGSTRLPEDQRDKRGEAATEGWQEGQLIRMISHRMLAGNVSAGQPVALGIYDVDLGHFKVTREFDFEQPKVGEQLSLGHRRTHQIVTIRITGITRGAEGADQVIYTFRQA